jgi:hypothetical protein
MPPMASRRVMETLGKAGFRPVCAGLETGEPQRVPDAAPQWLAAALAGPGARSTPYFWYSRPGLLQGGLINYAPAAVFAHGDNSAYPEYHWHGLQLLAGNLYLLAGVELFAVTLAAAWRLRRQPPATGCPPANAIL